jgi:predicted ribosomally synthesized peptide with SipW-like signal peptide
MKIKAKLLALLLAAVITTGVGGFGTYAYFTDKNQASEQVSLIMGNLKLQTYWLGAWAQTRSNLAPSDPAVREAVDKGTRSDVSFDDSNLKFTNVKPGDVFQRDIVVHNIGSLIASNVIIKANQGLTGCVVTVAPKAMDSLITATTPGDQYNIKKLLVGNECTTYREFIVTVTVNDLNDELNTATVQHLFDGNVDLVTVTGEQLK